LVLIPSYNSGRLLRETVVAALAAWAPVWVVVDGSTDGSADDMPDGVQVLRLPVNGGKGTAVRHGAAMALQAGFTHALVMDADGQHPAEHIGVFMAASLPDPDAMVLGQPQFGPDAPWVRVQGRRLSNGLAGLAAGATVGDALFGFRVYPLRPLLDALAAGPGLQGFDFDPGVLVRLVWAAVRQVRLPAPVRYPGRARGAVSHFRYGRDNLLLARLHLRLLVQSIRRRARRE
jgi:glycosyltransferase involved in cell wall biosynthesis